MYLQADLLWNNTGHSRYECEFSMRDATLAFQKLETEAIFRTTDEEIWEHLCNITVYFSSSICNVHQTLSGCGSADFQTPAAEAPWESGGGGDTHLKDLLSGHLAKAPSHRWHFLAGRLVIIQVTISDFCVHFLLRSWESPLVYQRQRLYSFWSFHASFIGNNLSVTRLWIHVGTGAGGK